MLNVGDVLQGRYRIISQLGQGGMGAVYHAWDTRLSIPVALKEMFPQANLDAEVLEQLRNQFQQEATVLARLNHPHLVGVTDFFEEDLNVYLVMKYVEGESLAAQIQREGALSEEQVVNWCAQLLDALAYCHNQGIIHRDIKPQNIIIRSNGEAVLVDFGLVKLWDPNDPKTRTAVRGVGTPQYAPPEQYELDAGHTEPRSDLYSLGATMYHALTGQAPPTATLRIAAPEEFVPIRQVSLTISESVAETIERAMELPRSRRWGSAAAMAAALGVSVRNWGGQATPSTISGRGGTIRMDSPAQRFGLRRLPKWAWWVGGLALLLVAGAVIFALFGFPGAAQVTPTVTGDALTVSGPTEAPEEDTPTSTATSTPTPTSTPTSSPTPEPSSTPTDTPEPSPSPTDMPTETPTPEPTPTLTPVPQPTAVPTTQAEPTSVPVPTTQPAPTPDPAAGTGRIIFTVQIADSLYLYSTDPATGGMLELGKTDYGHSTCGGTATASTITGQAYNLYGINKCNLTERTDACTSPDGQYKVITNFVDGGWTVSLLTVADDSSQWFYQGDLNRDVGVHWAFDSQHAFFAVQNTVYVITVGYGNLQPVITYMDPEWLPQFSPDGSLIYYLKPVGAEGNSDVFVVNTDGTGDRNLTNSAFARKLCPRWRR